MSPEDIAMGLTAIASVQALDADWPEALDVLMKDEDAGRGAVALAYALLAWRGDVLPVDVLSILRKRLLEQL